MNGYLLSVIGTVLLCSLLTTIAPEGKTSTVIKGVARLVCVLAIIAPALRFFKTGSIDEFTDESGKKFFTESVIESEGTFIQYYSELRIRETENALEKELAEKYDAEGSVALAWSFQKETLDEIYEENRIRIDGITVKLRTETDEEVKKAMWLYLTKNYCSEVLIE